MKRDPIFAAEQALRGDLFGWLHDHTEQEGECMIWQGGYSSGRVPCMRLPKALPPKPAKGSSCMVRIVVWEASSGRKLKNGHVTWPSCGNPGCVDPKHIRTGTRREAYKALKAAGRHAVSPSAFLKITASRQNRSPITWEAVHQLRALYESIPIQRYGFHNRESGLIRPSRSDVVEKFAQENGIGIEAAWRIARGQTWKVQASPDNPFSQLLRLAA